MYSVSKVRIPVRTDEVAQGVERDAPQLLRLGVQFADFSIDLGPIRRMDRGDTGEKESAQDEPMKFHHVLP